MAMALARPLAYSLVLQNILTLMLRCKLICEIFGLRSICLVMAKLAPRASKWPRLNFIAALSWPLRPRFPYFIASTKWQTIERDPGRHLQCATAPQGEGADPLGDAARTETVAIDPDAGEAAAGSGGRRSAGTPTKNETGVRGG